MHYVQKIGLVKCSMVADYVVAKCNSCAYIDAV